MQVFDNTFWTKIQKPILENKNKFGPLPLPMLYSVAYDVQRIRCLSAYKNITSYMAYILIVALSCLMFVIRITNYPVPDAFRCLTT